jgi:F0F1-type ATP synthase assembly protein I
MKKNEDQEENLEQKTSESEQQSPINKGDEFMRLRRKRSESSEQSVEPKNGDIKMTTSVILVFSTLITIGGTLLGFLFGWFAHSYFVSVIDTLIGEPTEEQIAYTPHPEMMDEEGNPIPFQVSKLISVEFDQRDAFDTDPFPED